MTVRNKLLVLGFLALVVLSALPPVLRADDPNRAALVIRFDDNNVAMQCIEFSEDQISGYDLLTRANQSIEVDFQGQGAAICAVGGTGCPANDCFCQCKGGGDCVYWSYFRQSGGAWQYSQAGATLSTVTDGSVEGWSWGPGSVTNAIAPPDVAFEEVCTTAPPTSTFTPSPTATDIVIAPEATNTRAATAVPPTSTMTATPTRTPAASRTPTAVPTAIPTNTAVATAAATNTAVAPVDATPTLPATSTAAAAPPTPFPTSTPARAEVLPVTAVASVQPDVVAATDVPPTAAATATAPSPQLPPGRGVVIAAATQEVPQVATVIGANSVPPTAVGALDNAPESAPESGPLVWLPYVIFLLIVAALGMLLLLANQMRRSD